MQEDILAKQVENRSRYLEDFLVQAQNLGDMPNRINEKTEAAADLRSNLKGYAGTEQRFERAAA